MRPTILLPTYNERDNIKDLIAEITQVVPHARILVIDDNSPDGTAAEVKKLQSTYPELFLLERQEKTGLGKAYVDGYKNIFEFYRDTDIICMMDADFSHHPKYLPDIFALMSDYDMVIGSRYSREGHIEGWEKKREWLSRAGNAYVRLITRLPIRDCTSGFECIRTDILKQLTFSDLDPSGYAFQIALKYKLWRLHARIKEIPICFYSRRNGESKISWRIVFEGLLIPWKLIFHQNKHPR